MQKNKKRFGAPAGNKNALGNKGGKGGPVGNKYALKTGEFEKIAFDTLDEQELILIEKIPIDKDNLLKQEIQLLTVRERRMLKRIENLKKKKMVLETETYGMEGDKENSYKEYTNSLNKIQEIESALTRVQEKKLKCIELLAKFEDTTINDKDITIKVTRVSEMIES